MTVTTIRMVSERKAQMVSGRKAQIEMATREGRTAKMEDSNTQEKKALKKRLKLKKFRTNPYC